MVVVEREKHRLANEHAQAQQMVKQLEAEKTHLDQELAEARQIVEKQTGQMHGLHQQLQDSQASLGKAAEELASLQRQYDETLQHTAALTNQLHSVMTEKQQLEARLTSLKELRLAIREVKRKIWNERWAAWRARGQAKQEADQERLASGNRGYVVRKGVTTLGSTLRMHVHVLEPQSQ